MLVALAPLIYLSARMAVEAEMAKRQAVAQYVAARRAQRFVMAAALFPVLPTA